MRKRHVGLLVVAIILSSACKKEIARIEAVPVANVNASRDEAISGSTDSRTNSFKPKNGYVPNEQTAISIAVAVWIPIYGKEQIESEQPFRATLKNGVWTVVGTLPEGAAGGTAVAEIAQVDGRILRIIHYQ